MDLPKELIYIILSNLSSKNRSEICSVSKYFYNDILTYSKKIWPDLTKIGNININDYHLLMRLKNKHIMSSQMVFTTNDMDVIHAALKYHRKFTEPAITASKYGHLNIISFLLATKLVALHKIEDKLFKNAIKYKSIDIINFLLRYGVKYAVKYVCMYANLELSKQLFYIDQKNIPANYYAFVLQNEHEDAVNYMTTLLKDSNYIDINCTIHLVAESNSILAVDRLIALGVDPKTIYEWSEENDNFKFMNYLKPKILLM